MQPDSTDWKIIEILREGYEPNNSIARKLDVSEGMIRSRIKRLKEAGIMTVRAQIDPEILADKMLATITVTVAESRLLDQKAKEILNLPDVLSVSIVSGRYDLIVEVLLDSNHGLVRFLTEELSKIDGISKTESFVILKSYNKFV